MNASDAQRPPSNSVAVIGGGPAGLMAAEVLAQGGAAVTVYDQMTSLGRKFLLAGRGGLNLTHSEDLALFLTRYGDADPLLRGAIEAFPPSGVARVGRQSRATDLHRLERTGVSHLAQDLAAAADLVAAPRQSRRHRQPAPSLGRLGRERSPALHDAGRRAIRHAGGDRPGARRRQLAAARIGRALGSARCRRAA